MTPVHSQYVDRTLAERAVDMARPLIEEAMRNPAYGDSGFLHIVVMDPVLTPANASFEQAIIFEHSIGDRARWDADYQAFARAKARLSWRLRLDGHVVHALQPYLLQPDDVSAWGSVALNDIVVGVSGAFPSFDELYATVVAACVRGLAKARAAEAMKQA